VLHNNGYDTVEVSALVPVSFPDTRSGILGANGSMAWCCTFGGLEGLFRKDQDLPRAYGRHLCDLVKVTFDCGGFFTSDELPRYGITRAEIRYLYQTMRVQPGSGVLIAIFAYDEALSARIRGFLIDYFAQEVRRTRPHNHALRPAILEIPGSAARLRLAGD
jgi:Glu-tRNA(Gln) amidotransferase subunit E-like FAD-binding protein